MYCLEVGLIAWTVPDIMPLLRETMVDGKFACRAIVFKLGTVKHDKQHGIMAVG